MLRSWIGFHRDAVQSAGRRLQALQTKPKVCYQAPKKLLSELCLSEEISPESQKWHRVAKSWEKSPTKISISIPGHPSHLFSLSLCPSFSLSFLSPPPSLPLIYCFYQPALRPHQANTLSDNSTWPLGNGQISYLKCSIPWPLYGKFTKEDKHFSDASINI